MKFFKFFVLTLLCVCLMVGSVFAQRLTGKVTGTVSDADGTPLPGVTVEISSPSLMGGVQAQFTSTKGSYRFINLPPGTYKLDFKLEGFQTLERGNVKLSIGKTVTENLVLQQATLEESVTVTAAAPVVDVTQSGISHVFSKDDLEKLPVGRNSYYDVIKFAPGLLQTGQGSDNTVAFGSNSESNSIRIDGTELSSPAIGTGLLNITAEAFEEIETFGLGAPAEYGSFTGAVVNIVTKSGSNSFHGALSYYGQFDALTADNNPRKVLDPSVPPEEAGDHAGSAYSYHRDKYVSAAINLGGPIIKDRLWFYGAFERRDEKTAYWNMYPGYALRVPSTKVFFKLSAQPASRHKLTGSFYYEDFDNPDTPDPWAEQSNLGHEIGSRYSWNSIYTWQLSNNAFFELKYAGYRLTEDYIPISGDMDTPPRWDWASDDTFGGMWSEMWWWIESRHQAHANFSYFAEDFLGGDHEFKIGAQYYRGDSKYPTGYPGEGYFYDGYGYPYYFYHRDVWNCGSAENSFGAFVDDSWKIGDRLTLNLGFRFDFINAYTPELPIMDGWKGPTSETTPAVKDMIVWNSFSPRIGLVFQLTSDQKTLLKATYGRYYDKNLMENWNYPGPNGSDFVRYEYKYIYDWDNDPDFPDFVRYEPGWDLEEYINDYYVHDYTLPGEATYVMDPDIKNPYSDLFSIGLERELLPDFAIGVTYVYKKQKDLIGIDETAGIYEEVPMVSDDNDQTYTVFDLTSDEDAVEHFITNPSGYEQIYKAVMLTLYKRYSHNWMLNASLTYSKSEGLNNLGKATSAAQQGVIWYGDYMGRDPNDLINARGRMTSDRPWILKVQAGYTFPWDILASFNWIYQTGRPAPSFTRFLLNQGWQRVLTEPRGEDRFPTWSMMDLRLQKTFNITDTVKFQAIFDVWNVLNANTATTYASYRMWQDNYLETSNIFYPRRLQIGLKLQF